MNKKTLLALHSWLGLKLSLLMFIVSVTGTLAVVSHEIDWLIDSDMRVQSQPQKVNWDAIQEQAQVMFPERQLVLVNAPLYANFAAVALTIDPELGARRTLFNPYSGEFISDKDWYASAQRILRDLHRYLLSPIGGIYIVGPLGIVLLLSIVTALLFYRKWWRGFFKLQLDKGMRAFIGSLHKVMGLWSLWFTLLMAITGIWYLAEAFVADIGIDIQFDRPRITEQSLQQRPIYATAMTPSEAAKIATDSIDGLHISNISFPRDMSQPYYITGQTDAVLVRDRSNHVFIDPMNGDILRRQVTADQSLFERWIDMADPLHFGNFGGLAVKFIWLLFGIMMCALTATGVLIFLRRIKNQHHQSTSKLVLGSFKYATGLLLLIPTVMISIKLSTAYGLIPQTKATKAITLFSAEHNLRVKLSIAEDQESGLAFVRYTLNCGGCLANTLKAKLILTDGTSRAFTQHEGGFLAATEAKVETSKLNQIMAIRFQLPNGTIIEVSRS